MDVKVAVGVGSTTLVPRLPTIDIPNTALKFKPKDVPGYPFAIYVSGFRLGAQFDLGPVNFDFNYTINMNSATKTDFRTNSHVFRFLLGWLF